MRLKNNLNTDSLVTLILFLCILVCSLFCVAHYLIPYLWYDEAGQFWISKGLNHYSAPLSSEGGLCDVIQNNRNYNLDPGGFSVLLFFVLKICDDLLFIRLLPVVFFVGCSFFCYRYMRVSEDKKISLLFSLVIFAIPIINTRVSELRAYSMEMCGTIMVLFLLQKLSREISIKDILLLSLVSCFSFTSRYGFFAVIAYTGIRLLYLSIKQKTGVVTSLLIYSIPIVCTVAIVYLGMMAYQKSTIGYVGYISHSPILLLSPLSLLYYFNIIVAITNLRSKKCLSELHMMAIGVSSVYFLFSVMSLYPWDFHRTMSASLLLCLSTAEFLIYKLKSYNLMYGVIFGIIVLTASTLVTVRRLAHLPFEIKNDPVAETRRYKDSHQEEILYIHYMYSPSVRWFYEYGSGQKFKVLDDYPNSFILDKGEQHSVATHKDERLSEERTGNGSLLLLPDNIPTINAIERVENYCHLYKWKD